MSNLSPPDPTPDYRNPSAPATAGPTTPALSPEQLQEIALANQRAKKLNRAVVAAKIDGGITGFFSVCCLLSFCMGWENLVLGVIFGYVAFTSFRNAARLKAADVAAPGRLALNQLVLGSSIILYAAWALFQGLRGGSSLDSAIGDTSSIGINVQDLTRTIYWWLYGTLIVGTLFAQGGAALYYLTRKKYVQAYRDQTPEWVIKLQAIR